jgi:hypothetical protein
VFWAFVAYQGGAANFVSPTLFHYGWSSYQFMYEDGYYQRSANGKVEWDEDNEPIFFPWKDNQGRRTIDAHVYIHEVGHLLGLLDYYSYDRSQGDWGPTGALDMMDFNIGDHNGFSKMALGWIPPSFMIQPGTVVLPSIANQPSLLMLTKLIPTTMMDEYILIEFYQPIGLNQNDSQASFSGRYPRMFSTSGLKIYHIDARIAQLMVTNQGLTFDAYVKDMVHTSGYRYQLAHSNTMSRNAIGTNPNFKLRATHHDTKISNLLFDDHDKGICVIDLDTLMPGYFISDLGDMFRTYLCAVSEEETDFSSISVRPAIYKAIVRGYLKGVGNILSKDEAGQIYFAGLFMIYMQALRFLTDYINDDVYYGAKYPLHNYNRAFNQIKLLEDYINKKELLQIEINN